VVWQPNIHVGRTVGLGGIGVAIEPIELGREGALWRVDLGVLQPRRHGARHQIHQRLIIAILHERQLCDFLCLELGVRVGLVRLQQLRLGSHRHRLGELAEIESSIHAADRVHGNGHIGPHVLLEPLQ
jgi:hypothetical protein